MTARKILLLTVLGVLGSVGVATFGVFAAPSKPDFGLAVSPSSQSTTAGNTATYSVTISRTGGFTSAVALSVSGLPAGSTASFDPPSPVAGPTTTLRISTSTTTPAGSKALTLTGTGGGKTRTASLTLVVHPATTPGFNLNVSPSAQTIGQGGSTSFSLSITRLNGFSGNVALSVSGLPKKTSGVFTPSTIAGPSDTTSTLGIVAQTSAETGAFALAIKATGGGVTRTASVTLNVEKKQEFRISGNAAQALYPGALSVIDLTLTNPNNFTIRVSPLQVSIEEHTSNPGCSGSQNFTTSALVGSVDVPGNTTATLSQLGVPQARMPKIRFANEPINQDACKHATITLQYSGTAVKP
jgi:uncharacterized membrane protein